MQASADDARVFGERALARSRTVTTIVGPQEAVAPFWDVVAGLVGRPRELRWDQPHLELDRDSAVAPDPVGASYDAGPTST